MDMSKEFFRISAFFAQYQVSTDKGPPLSLSFSANSLEPTQKKFPGPRDKSGIQQISLEMSKGSHSLDICTALGS